MSVSTVIIGAGQAAAHAAMAMRAAAPEARIVLVGAEPHLPYERPPLSKTVLTGADGAMPAFFYPAERFAAAGIEVRHATPATGIDRAAGQVLLGDGTRLGYEALLIATGGRARMLAVPGAERALVLRTHDDAQALRARLMPGARLVCIGAGVIGMEVAASARHRGCAVTVIEAGPTPLGRAMARPIAQFIAEMHHREGVSLRLGAGVAAIEPDAVRLSDGERVPADVVLAGIGMVRNSELAREAGLAVDDGVLVDEFGRTEAEGIFAAGDVTAFWHPGLGRRLRLESWRHAQDHGAAVGRAIAGAREPYAPVPWFWTDQFGRNIQVAGLPTDAVATVWRGDPADPSFTAFHLDAGGRLVAATGVDAPRDVRAAMPLIRSGAVVDPAALRDPAVKLQTLRERS
ncbi:MAG: FAD-dependent oxidoreductase [Alphaproteobacteria bacterium]|nr:FAD-dependent oxidoreductase [Alphaproteobacteria bacterium]